MSPGWLSSSSLNSSERLSDVKSDDPFTARVFEALNGMMLDMLAAIARKDYDDRRRRQMQGIAKAKTEGKYRGRPEDKKRNSAIMTMLKRGMSWNSIIEAASGSGKKLSRATLSKLAKRVRGDRINRRASFRDQRFASISLPIHPAPVIDRGKVPVP
jgi:DNA invertase Pin-like site-specific DNA recombinase